MINWPHNVSLIEFMWLKKPFQICIWKWSRKTKLVDKYCWPPIGMIIWWLQYIVFNIRIKHGLIFPNGISWWIKAVHDMKLFFFWVIKILFTCFHQSLLLISVSELHPCNNVATFDLKLHIFLLHEVNYTVHYFD